MALPITDLKRWKPRLAPHGKSTFSTTPENTWRMDVVFTGSGDSWVYPLFQLPANIDPVAYSGFLVRERITHDARNVAIIAETDGSSPSFWVSELFPPDGSWHVVYVPFSEFKPGPIATGNQNTPRDLTLWKELSLGMGCRTAENSIEVSHLVLVGGTAE